MKYLFYYIFFIIIVFIFAYVNSMTPPKEEAFTPKMRELYRPYIRNVKHISEGFYNSQKQNVSNLFRKFGIM